MKITYEQLVKYNACKEQLDLFKNTFGKEVKITKSICKKYYRTFNFEWVMRRLFPIELRDKYYQDVKPLDVTYCQDTKPIYNKYLRDCYFLYSSKYRKECEPIYDKYAYDRAMLFYKLSLTLP